MHSISVTWLELFFDLAAVVATHNIVVPVEHHASFESLQKYALFIILLWFTWHQTSLAVNLSNKRRFEAGELSLGAEQWLGWVKVSSILTIMAFVTMMSNSAARDNNAQFYACWCLSNVVATWDAAYQDYKFKGQLQAWQVASALGPITLAAFSITGNIFDHNWATSAILAFFLLTMSGLYYGASKYDTAVADEAVALEIYDDGAAPFSISSIVATLLALASGRSQRAMPYFVNFDLMDKNHLVERYGLFVILLFGEGVTTASNALPDFSLYYELSSATIGLSICAFAVPVFSWGLYFASAPKNFKRLPEQEMGATRANLLYSYNHIGIMISWPLMPAGYAHLIAQVADKSAHDDPGGKEGHRFLSSVESSRNVQAAKLLICLSTAAFLAFSGALVALGQDPSLDASGRGTGGHHRSKRSDDIQGRKLFKVSKKMTRTKRARRFSPRTRGLVRASLGLTLAAASVLSCFIGADEEPWPAESWGYVAPLVLVLSAWVETRPVPRESEGADQISHGGHDDDDADSAADYDVENGPGTTDGAKQEMMLTPPPPSSLRASVSSETTDQYSYLGGDDNDDEKNHCEIRVPSRTRARVCE